MDSSPSLNRKHHKKHSAKSGEKKEKKRKHRVSEADVPSSPTKKHKHKHKHKHRSEQTPSNDAESSALPLPIECSPFHLQTSSLYLPIPPIGQHHPLQTLCADHVSPLLLTYYPPFHGVIISYSNPRLSTDPGDLTSKDGRQKVYARSISEYAAPFVWLTADFLVLNPQKGDVCEGYISLQNETSIGLICWNFFSASIETSRLPSRWKWRSNGKFSGKRKQKLKSPSQEDGMDVDGESEAQEATPTNLEDAEGYFQDENGNKVSGVVKFWVKDVDTSCSTSREFDFMSILGTMLTEEEEQQLRRNGKSALPNGSSEAQSSQAAAGAMTNGYDGVMDVDNASGAKYRVKS